MITNPHYMAVLEDLQQQRVSLDRSMQELTEQMREIEALIASLRKRALASNGSERSLLKERPLGVVIPPSLPGLSIRWGILRLLADYASGPMSNAEICEAIKEQGVGANSEKLRNNVGAVLSRMSTLKEVNNTGNSYLITEDGREIWRNIKNSPKYQNLLNPGQEATIKFDEFVDA